MADVLDIAVVVRNVRIVTVAVLINRSLTVAARSDCDIARAKARGSGGCVVRVGILCCQPISAPVPQDCGFDREYG